MIASSRLETLLNAGQFVLSAELTPPRHYNVLPIINRAEKIVPYVDVVQINDNVLSQARLSNLVAAHLIQQAGIEPVVQFSLRHKNRIALQSDLLGLAALRIRNVIVLGGYPCSIGTDPDAKDATDLSPVEAISAIHNMTTQGQMFNGDVINPAPDFYIGTIAFPSANPDELDESITRLEAKINSGARYIQLQATFDLASMERWMAEVVKRGLHERAHFIGAIFPFTSLKGLEFLQKIPGLSVPEALFERLSSKNSMSEYVDATLEMIEGIRAIEGIRGLHLRSLRFGHSIPLILQLVRLRQAQMRTLASV